LQHTMAAFPPKFFFFMSDLSLACFKLLTVKIADPSGKTIRVY